MVIRCRREPGLDFTVHASVYGKAPFYPRACRCYRRSSLPTNPPLHSIAPVVILATILVVILDQAERREYYWGISLGRYVCAGIRSRWSLKASYSYSSKSIKPNANLFPRLKFCRTSLSLTPTTFSISTKRSNTLQVFFPRDLGTSLASPDFYCRTLSQKLGIQSLSKPKQCHYSDERK